MIYFILLLLIIIIILYRKYNRDRDYKEYFTSDSDSDSESDMDIESSIDPIISKGKIIGITINSSADYNINDPPDIKINRNEDEKHKYNDAKLYPIIKDKKIIGVVIESEGSGYTDKTTIDIIRSSSQKSIYNNIMDTLKSIKDILYKEYETKIKDNQYVSTQSNTHMKTKLSTGSSELDDAINKLGTPPKPSVKSFSDLTPSKNSNTTQQPVNTKYPVMNDNASPSNSSNNPSSNSSPNASSNAPPSTIPSINTNNNNTSLPTTITGLSDSQILQYAQNYDTAMQPILASQKKAQSVAEAQLDVINQHLKKEKEATEYASQNGLPPPPKKYSQTEINKLNNTISKSKNNKYYTMNNDTKAQCYLLLEDTNNKQKEATELGQQSENNPTLQYTAKQYVDLYNIALSKYNSTCT